MNDWLEKRREKARAEGRRQSAPRGRRWEDAHARNEPFDEPPPDSDDD